MWFHMMHQFDHNSTDPQFTAAMRDLGAGRLRTAEKKFEEILKEDPEHADALLALTDLQMSKGEWIRAAHLGRRLLIVLPTDDPRGYFALGGAQARLSRFEHAILNLERARVLAPDHPEVLRNLGWVYCMIGEDEKGRDFLRECLRRDPENVTAMVDMAMSYHFRARYQEAREWIEKAMEIEPENPFFREPKRFIDEMEGEFLKLSPEEQVLQRAQFCDPDYRKHIRAQSILSTAVGKLSKKDVEEIKSELEALGLRGFFHAVKDMRSGEGRAAKEYIKVHERIGHPQLLEKQEIDALERELAAPRTPRARQKEILVTLGNAGSLDALQALTRASSELPAAFAPWLELATDECKALLASEINDEPRISVRFEDRE